MITKDSRNILVADDSLFFRTRLSDILIEAGHKVKFAKDGNEAINEIKANSSGMDLLILDLQMPGVDGFAVLKWINENGYKGKFPVLAITGAYEPTSVMENLKSLGASGFMSKVFPPEQIIFRVNRLLFTDKATSGVARERVPVSIPVDFTFGGVTNTGVLINISEGGAFLHTKAELLKGSMLELRFCLPGSNKIINTRGIVRWFPYEIVSKIIFCGYGINFTSISHEDQELLNDFISGELGKIDRVLGD